MIITILEMRPGWNVREQDLETSFSTKSCVTWASLSTRAMRALRELLGNSHGASRETEALEDIVLVILRATGDTGA